VSVDGPRSRPTSSRQASYLFWVLSGALLIGLEAAWFFWFEKQPLPNGQNFPRWMFLARALPAFVPGVEFAESYFGLALQELRHVENLPARLPIVLASGLILAAALGLGGLVLRALRLNLSLTRTERFGLAFGLGTSGLSVGTLIVGRLGLLSPWPVCIGLAAIAITEAVLLYAEALPARVGRTRGTQTEVDPARVEDNPWHRLLGGAGFLLIVGPFLVMMALGSMLPTIDFDAIEYHLQGPKEYFQAGRITFLPHNVYTSMPFSVEMLHLLGMEAMNDWWWGGLVGQFLIAIHAPMAALMVALTARRIASPRAAWFAAVVYLTTPWIYRLAVLPYVEGPLGYYHAALLWITARAWSESDHLTRRSLWGAAGLIAGGAMACKYPALISAVLPFGLAALIDACRRRRPAVVLAFCLGWAVMMSPWLGKNLLDTGNPVYPLGHSVFGGMHWNSQMEQKWIKAHGPRPVTLGLFWQSILDVAGRSDWQSPLFGALAPLAFLRRGSRRASAVLWGYVAYLFLTWWLLTHRLDRFWLPILPVLAVLAGLGADWTRRLGWSIALGLIVGLSVIANLSYSSTALTAMNNWTDDLNELRTSVPKMLDPGLFAADTHTPKNAKILIVGQAAVFHVNHPIVYNTVFDEEVFEILTRDKSPEEVRAALKELGVTHIYVDWYQIDRFRSPGNYGFTDFVTPREFDRLVQAGVLDPPESMKTQRELYRVR
jgi:Dolichyl-phosphate-mannose-protein mannosyltransferase